MKKISSHLTHRKSYYGTKWNELKNGNLRYCHLDQRPLIFFQGVSLCQICASNTFLPSFKMSFLETSTKCILCILSNILELCIGWERMKKYSLPTMLREDKNDDCYRNLKHTKQQLACRKRSLPLCPGGFDYGWFSGRPSYQLKVLFNTGVFPHVANQPKSKGVT